MFRRGSLYFGFVVILVGYMLLQRNGQDATMLANPPPSNILLILGACLMLFLYSRLPRWLKILSLPFLATGVAGWLCISVMVVSPQDLGTGFTISAILFIALTIIFLIALLLGMIIISGFWSSLTSPSRNVDWADLYDMLEHEERRGKRQ